MDNQSLCVIPGVLCWKIVVDVNVINHDGNVFDCSVLAALASWTSFKLPFLRRLNNKVTLGHGSMNLSCLHIPFSLTFGILNNGHDFILDPDVNIDIKMQCS